MLFGFYFLCSIQPNSLSLLRTSISASARGRSRSRLPRTALNLFALTPKLQNLSWPLGIDSLMLTPDTQRALEMTVLASTGCLDVNVEVRSLSAVHCTISQLVACANEMLHVKACVFGNDHSSTLTLINTYHATNDSKIRAQNVRVTLTLTNTPSTNRLT